MSVRSKVMNMGERRVLQTVAMLAAALLSFAGELRAAEPVKVEPIGAESWATFRNGSLAEDAGLCEPSDPRAGELLADFVARLAEQAKLPNTLTKCRVDPAKIPEMAVEAAQQWTGKFNPRPVDEKALRDLYEGAL